MVFGKKAKKTEDVKAPTQEASVGAPSTPPPEDKEKQLYEPEDFIASAAYRAEMLNINLLSLAECRLAKDELKRIGDCLERMEKAQ